MFVLILRCLLTRISIVTYSAHITAIYMNLKTNTKYYKTNLVQAESNRESWTLLRTIIYLHRLRRVQLNRQRAIASRLVVIEPVSNSGRQSRKFSNYNSGINAAAAATLVRRARSISMKNS